jgi:hypothetical protein
VKNEGRMVSNSNYKCWEIMNCDDLDCPARREPETPCWEIAKRIEDFRYVSNTCKDCVVYLLKEETSILSKKDLQNIIKQRGLLKSIENGQQVCVLKTNASK